KEEAIGILMAVEMWVKRNHEAEMKTWNGWLDSIAQRVSTVKGITTNVQQPRGLSNKTPSLRVLWDRQALGLSAETASKALLDGEPRIATAPARGDNSGGGAALVGVSITPYMMHPGDEKIVA